MAAVKRENDPILYSPGAAGVRLPGRSEPCCCSQRCSPDQRRRALVASAVLILWVFSMPVIADAIMRSLEDRYPYRALDQCPVARTRSSRSAAASVGPRDQHGTGPQWGTCGGALRTCPGVVPVAARSHPGSQPWHRRWQSPPLGGRAAEGNCREPRLFPEQSIIVTPVTSNTATEADALCGMAARLHWKRLISSSTSAFHMPRAMQLFHGCPAEIIPVPVDYSTSDVSIGSNWALDRYLPRTEALLNIGRALREPRHRLLLDPPSIGREPCGGAPCLISSATSSRAP